MNYNSRDVEGLTTVERLERIEKLLADPPKVKLDDIPVAQLQRKLEKQWQPDGSLLLLPGSVSESTIQPPEDWHVVGAAGQPAFQNAWANTGAGFDTAAFYRDVLGRVTIRGLVTGGALNTIIFTLPLGFRPVAGLVFPAWQNGAYCAMQVLAAGSVQQISGAAVVNVTINCSFRAS